MSLLFLNNPLILTIPDESLILTFPDELLTLIFSGVGYREIISLHTVCKRFDDFCIHNKKKVMLLSLDYHPFKEEVIKDFFINNNNKMLKRYSEYLYIDRMGNIVSVFDNGNQCIDPIAKNIVSLFYNSTSQTCVFALDIDGNLYSKKYGIYFKMIQTNKKIYKIYPSNHAIVKYFDGSVVGIESLDTEILENSSFINDHIGISDLVIKKYIHFYDYFKYLILTEDGCLYICSFKHKTLTGKLLKNGINDICYTDSLLLILHNNGTLEIVGFFWFVYIVDNVKKIDEYPLLLKNNGEMIRLDLHHTFFYKDPIDANIDKLINFYNEMSRLTSSNEMSIFSFGKLNVVDMAHETGLFLTSDNKLYRINENNYKFIRKYDDQIKLIGGNYIKNNNKIELITN
jgi:hypothetical protein